MNQTSNTREQIIDTAFKLLLQRGMNGFSYRDIADPLGVKNAAIHYHFPSKTDLVRALIEQNHQLLKKATAEFMAYGGPARPQLEGLFHFTRTQMELGRPVCMVGALSVDYEELTDANKKQEIIPMVKSPATKSLDPMSGGVSGSIPWNMDFDLSSPDTLLIRLSGNWKIANRLPAATEVAKQLAPGARIKKVSFDATALSGWDSGLITFLLKVFEFVCEGRHCS